MKIYYDDDADLSLVQEQNVAILGYGNQGRAQAMNLRDSGVNVLVGNVADSYAEQARSDGFDVHPMAEVVPQANVIVVLLPDELHAELYETEIASAAQIRADAAVRLRVQYSLWSGPPSTGC